MLKRLAWLLVLLILAGGGVAGVLYLRINQPYRGYTQTGQYVEIPQGDGSRAIVDCTRRVAGPPQINNRRSPLNKESIIQDQQFKNDFGIG